jgi:hypothetical protein
MEKEKLKKVYDTMVRDGHITNTDVNTFDKWGAAYSKPDKQVQLYTFLKENKYVTKPQDEWIGSVFAPEKKKPEAGQDASGTVSGMASPVTPTEVSPAPDGGEEVGDIYQMFQKRANEATIAAQAKTKAAYEAQPLSKQFTDYYKKQYGIGDLEMANPEGKSPEQRAIIDLASRTSGVPGSDDGTAGEIEARLQKIKARTDPNDKRSIENAALDAKAVLMDYVPAGFAPRAWSDYAQSEANFADYDPQGYSKRVEQQIVDKYSKIGLDKPKAYTKLIEGSLDDGVMDDDRTHEALLNVRARTWAKKLDDAKAKGDPDLIKFAEYKKAEADAAAKGMMDQRLAQVDKEIADVEKLMMSADPNFDIAELEKGYRRLKAMREGFINPDAKIQQKYATYQEEADSVTPEGTPREKLENLYAELVWRRKQVAGRIAKHEGKSAADYGFRQMSHSFLGFADGGYNADHKALVSLDSQIKDLAPIVFLNESPAVRDEKAGFLQSAKQGLLTTVGSEGSPMSGTGRQQDALMLDRNLQIAGVTPEALNDPSQYGIAERTKEPGLSDSEYWGNLLGTSGGLMFHIMLASRGANALGLGKTISALTGRTGGAIMTALGDAVESGLTYKAAGELSVGNQDELTFMGGLFGGAASTLGKGGFSGAKKMVAGLFGDKADDAAKLIIDFGAKRLGAGVGETFEETGQQIVQMWNQSTSGQTFWEKMDKQFGELPEAAKFFVSTMVMGMGMGSAHSDGFGNYMLKYANDQLAAMPPVERAAAEQALEEIEEEAHDMIDTVREEGIPSTGEAETEAQRELTPEAQAAQEELRKREETDKMAAQAGLSDRLETTMSNEDRIREELSQLEAQQQRQELTENENRRMKNLQNVVTGLDQIAQGNQYVQPEDVVNLTPEGGPTIDVINPGDQATEPAKKKVVSVGGVDFTFNADELGLDEAEKALEEIAAADNSFVEEAPAEAVATEQANPLETPSQQAAPMTRDQEIAGQINEFFTNLAGTIGENAVGKIKEYADRIISGESRDSIIEGLKDNWVEAIDQAVALQQKPAAEETKKTPKKRKPNPDRKTKKKPAKELTPTQAMTEASVATIEARQDPTPENAQREQEVAAQVESNAEQVAESLPKTKKKDARKEKRQSEAPSVAGEGALDSFVEVVPSTGRRRQWKKVGKDWFFRDAKRGTPLEEVAFTGDWTPVNTREMIDKAERMAVMDPLTLEIVNSAKEAAAALVDVFTMRAAKSGMLQSRFDLGLGDPMIRFSVAVFKGGKAIAIKLAEAGALTYENWESAMRQVYGDHVATFLEQAWDNAKDAVKAAGPQQRTESKEKSKPAAKEKASTTEESKDKERVAPTTGERTGTQKLMEKYISGTHDALKSFIMQFPMLKGEYDQKKVFSDAMDEVKEAINDNKVANMVNDLVQPYSSRTGDSDQMKRMILAKMFGAMAEESTRARDKAALARDKAAEKKAQKDLDLFTGYLTSMALALNDNALGAGRTGAASAMWATIGRSMDVYAVSVIDKANRKAMSEKKASNGKTLDVATKEAADNLNDQRQQAADAIANSVAGDIDTAANNNTTHSLSERRKAVKEKKNAAIERYKKIVVGGTLNSLMDPAGLAKLAALAEIGYYTLQEGALAFADWANSMRRDIPGLSDQDLSDIWGADLNGRTLGQVAEDEKVTRALQSITNTLESTPSQVTETATEIRKLRNRMAKDLVEMIDEGKTIDDFKKKYGLTDAQADELADSINSAPQENIEKLAGSKAKAKKVQDAAESYMPKPKVQRTEAEKAEMKQKRELRARVKEVIRDHFKKPDGRPLIDKLTEAGLDATQAAKVEQAVRDNAQKIMAQAVAGELDHIASNESKKKSREFKPAKKGQKKTQAQTLIDRLVDGEISDRYLQGMLAHRYGLGTMPTAEQVVQLRKLGQAVEQAAAGSNLQKIAMRELAQVLDTIMPRDKTAELGALWRGLIFASTLNSVGTFATNLHSVSDHALIGWLKALTNPIEWGEFFQAVLSNDQNAWLLNPIAKTLIKMQGVKGSARNALNSLVSGLETGITAARYDESVMDTDPAKMLPALERRQRTAFGRGVLEHPWLSIRYKGKEYGINPWRNIFGKLVGRILTATDAATIAAYGDFEYLDAMRMAAGKAGKSYKELKSLMTQYLTENSQLWQDSLAQAIDEAASMEQLTGKPVSEKTIKVRAREIARKNFAPHAGITEGELKSVQMVAEYNVLALKRQGVMGHIASGVGAFKNIQHPAGKVFAQLMTPFFMFTEIPGNFGDMMLDNLPFYNILRQLGVTPSNWKFARERLSKTDTGSRLGEAGSRERRKQLESMYFSNFLMIGAYVLLKSLDDDDDDISGKEQKPSDSYQLFGIPYKNFAGLAPPLIFARAIIDAEKDPKRKTEGTIASFFGATMAAMTSMSAFYTDQTFMNGFQDLGKLMSAAGKAAKGEISGEAMFRAILKPYLTLAVKPLPTTQGFTRFMLDIVDPHKYTEENWTEMIAMVVGAERGFSEKRRGIFGEVLDTYPMTNIINIESIMEKVTGKVTKEKKGYEILAKTNTMIEAPRNSLSKFLDSKSEYGFTVREFTPKEWDELNKKAGELFLDNLLDADLATPGALSIKGTKFISTAQKDIVKMWADARSEVKAELFGDQILTESEAQSLLDEEYVQ